MAFFQLFPNAASISVAADNSTYKSINGMLLNAAQTDLLLVPEGMEGAAVLPSTLANVPACIFSRCTKLSAISCKNGSTEGESFTSQNGILYKKNGETLALVAAPAGLGTSATIASECTQIAEGAFLGNTALKTIVCNGEVAEIATSAADEQPESESDSGNGNGNGGDSSNGESISTSESPAAAFTHETVEIATVITNNKSAWEQAGFKNFAESAKPGDAATADGLTFTLLDDYTLEASWQGESAAPEELNIPASATINNIEYTVSTIAENGFAAQTSLKKVTLPDTITSIHANAFANSGLQSISIPGSVSTVGNNAFAGCENMSSATLAEGIHIIGNNAFESTAIEQLVLPASIKAVGDYAFANSPNLATIIAMGTPETVASTAIANCANVSIYYPYSGTEDSPWSVGPVANNNHAYAYGVKPAQDTFELEVGETANVFDNGGYLKAEGDVEVESSYRAYAISADNNGEVTAKNPGITPMRLTLSIMNTTISSATCSLTVLDIANYPELLVQNDDAGGSSNADNIGDVVMLNNQDNMSYIESMTGDLAVITLLRNSANNLDSAFLGSDLVSTVSLYASPDYSSYTAALGLFNEDNVKGWEYSTNSSFSNSTKTTGYYLNFAEAYSSNSWNYVPLAYTVYENPYYVKVEYYDLDKSLTGTLYCRPTVAGCYAFKLSDISTLKSGERHELASTGSTSVYAKFCSSYTAALGLFNEDNVKGWEYSTNSSFSNSTKTTGYYLNFAEAYSSNSWNYVPLAYTVYENPYYVKVEYYDLDKSLTGTLYCRPTVAGCYAFKLSDISTLKSGERHELASTGSTSVYAKFDPYTITWNPNGGKWSDNSTDAKTSTHNHDTTPSGLDGSTTPTRSGYTFKGWSTSSTATSGTTNIPAVVGDATYYAVWTIDAYTITWNPNGGKWSDGSTGNKTTTVEYGETPTPPETPTKDQTDQYTYSASWGTLSSVTADKTYTASWTSTTRSYTITWNPNGGKWSDGSTGNKTSSHNYGATPSGLDGSTTPTRSGYTFKGWSTSSTATSGTTNIPAVVGDATYYAVWTIDAYTITWNPNGGKWSDGSTGNKTSSHNYGATPSGLDGSTTPTRSGYTFKGWSTSSTATSGTTNIPAVSGSKTYYAIWSENTCTITFSAGTGGSVNPSGAQSNVGVVTGNKSSTATASTGYTFDGWYDGSIKITATSGNVYVSGSTLYVKGSSTSTLTTKTYTAKFTVNEVTLEYWNKAGTAKLSSTTFTPGMAKTLAANPGATTGYTAQGWANRPNEVNQDYDFGTTVTFADTSTKKLYLAESATYYSINYRGANSTGLENPLGYSIESPDFTLKNPAPRNGWTFTGWTVTGANGAGVVGNNTTSVTIKQGTYGNLTCETKWERIKYSISYSGDGTPVSGNPSEYYINSSDITLKNPGARTGYIFMGWTVSGAQGTGIADNGTTNVTIKSGTYGNLTCEAKWEPIEYTVVFDGNGADNPGSTPSKLFKYDETLSLTKNSFTRVGYDFKGWATSKERADAGKIDRADEERVSNLRDTAGTYTLYAVWEAHTYRVVFHRGAGDGGSMAEQIFKCDEQKKLTPNAFTKAHHNFVKWTTNEDGTGTAYTNEQLVENLTFENNAVINLYAQWTQFEFNVTFVTSDDRATDVVVHPSGTAVEPIYVTIGQKIDPEKAKTSCDGYTFKGWFKDEARTQEWNFNTDTMPAGDLVLYAKWEANTFKVTLKPGDGTGDSQTKTYTYGAKNQTLPMIGDLGFTRTGYTFNSWKKEGSDGTKTWGNGEEVAINLSFGEEVTLIAQWDPVQYVVIFMANSPSADIPIIGKMSAQTLTYDKVEALTKNAFSNADGMVEFAGWNTEQDGSGTAIADGAGSDKPLNLDNGERGYAVLFAQWKGAPYTVKFDANAGTDTVTGSMPDETFYWELAQELPENTFKRQGGFTFAGWNTKPDGTGTAYANKATVKNLPAKGQSEVTLYAQWNVVYNVTIPTVDHIKVLMTNEGKWITAEGSNATVQSQTPAKIGINGIRCESSEGLSELLADDSQDKTSQLQLKVASGETSVSLSPGDTITGSNFYFRLDEGSALAPATLPLQFELATLSPDINLREQTTPKDAFKLTFMLGIVQQ